MLIEFRVENHRSLRDEQILTFEAANLGDASDLRPRTVAGHDKKLLPAMAIYGANASGKSNVLSALSFMGDAVTLSQRLWEPSEGIPRAPFGWGEKRNCPSLFEATFLIAGVKHEYGFVVNDTEVQEEWLFAWPADRKQIWFEREGQHFKFGENFSGPNETIREVTRSNALFLSVASQHRHARLDKINFWFRQLSRSHFRHRSIPFRGNVERFFASEHFGLGPSFLFDKEIGQSENVIAAQIKKLLQAADIGVVEVKSVLEEVKFGDRTIKERRTLLQHLAGDENSWLELSEESQGTQTLFRLALPVFEALFNGTLFIADELESSLHPSLALAVLQLFNNVATNPNNAQILFTTHDTNLLSSIGTKDNVPPLRRDQIWFTEKNEECASELYPLTNYKPRKEENLERGYLQGRYGAIPYLGDFKHLMDQ